MRKILPASHVDPVLLDPMAPGRDTASRPDAAAIGRRATTGTGDQETNGAAPRGGLGRLRILSRVRQWFSRGASQSLAGRVLAVVLLALSLSHLAGLVIGAVDRAEQATAEDLRDLADRIAQLALVIDAVAEPERGRLIEIASGGALTVVASDGPAFRTVVDDRGRTTLVRHAIEAAYAKRSQPETAIQIFTTASGDGQQAERRQELRVSVRLDNDTWLNFTAPLAGPQLTIRPQAAVIVLVLLGTTLILSGWAIRLLFQPLNALAGAAVRFHHDVSSPALPETGPIEVRHLARAINRLQYRLRRYVDDRRQVLGAIARDLRTPITLLRLRAEAVEDPDLQGKLIGALDDMEAMIASSLSFIRQDALREGIRNIDLGALVEGICADMAEAGLPVRLLGAVPAACFGRPLAIKRALTNLIDNAVRYAGNADVRLFRDGDRIVITVDDEGPGMPDELIEMVFTPLASSDEAAMPKGGRIGLGLSNAWTIVRAHDGDITLENKDGGGLRSVVSLPVQKAAPPARKLRP
ncbi:MAG: HAMP domain-containing protein [Azospirillum sp.]|nr:HAMP domain-containing protein [Azospirillum sp.]